MQIFKHFLLACSIAIATSPLYLQAQDTDAQAAARAALQQKMRDLKGAAGTIETPAAAPENLPTPPEPKMKVQPVAPPMSEPTAATPANSPAPFVLPEGASPDLIEQARQATRARVAELQGNRKTAIRAGQEAPSPAFEPVFQPVAETVTTATKVTEPAKPSKAELRAAKEREAAEKRAAAEQVAAAKKAAQEQATKEKAGAAAAAKTAQAASMKAPVDEAKTAVDKQKTEAKAAMKAEADAKAKAAADAKAREVAEKAATKAAKKAKPESAHAAPMAFAPLEAPATNLPTTKEQALSSLTEQYKADKISAEEYHQQRAKILAEP